MFSYSVCFEDTSCCNSLGIDFKNPWEKSYAAKSFYSWQPFPPARLNKFAGDLMWAGICSCSVNIFKNAPSLVNVFSYRGKKKRKEQVVRNEAVMLLYFLLSQPQICCLFFFTPFQLPDIILKNTVFSSVFKLYK